MEQLLEMGFSDVDIASAVAAAQGNINRALELLLDGNVVSTDTFPSSMTRMVLGISQYSFDEGDTSACTTIACTALPSLLESLDFQRTIDVELLSSLLMEGIETHRGLSSSLGLDHVGVEDIFDQLPQLKSSVVRVTDSMQILLSSPDCFGTLLKEVVDAPHDRSKHIGIIVTKPPETLLLLIDPRPEGPIYLFDSHSRPQLGFNGAYFISSSDHRDVLQHLHALFPVPSVANVQTLSLMEQMYYSFDAVPFQRK